jgi:phage baseplate assembly protein W
MEPLDNSFLGKGWGFPPTFNRQLYGVEMLAEEDDVKSSIEIIISTITGERVMLPSFGCNLQSYVFEQMNVPNIAMIEKIVREALVYHEPRIIVESVTPIPHQAPGKLEVSVVYTIIITNTRYNHVFPFYMNEATNIER